MSVTVTTDVKETVKAFREFSLKAETNIQKALVRSAMAVEATAKKLFRLSSDPSRYGQPPRTQTGRLKASITHRLVSDGAEIGTNVEYAEGLEFGTSLTMPHPFMRPALEMRKADIEKEMAKAVKDAG